MKMHKGISLLIDELFIQLEQLRTNYRSYLDDRRQQNCLTKKLRNREALNTNEATGERFWSFMQSSEGGTTKIDRPSTKEDESELYSFRNRFSELLKGVESLWSTKVDYRFSSTLKHHSIQR